MPDPSTSLATPPLGIHSPSPGQWLESPRTLDGPGKQRLDFLNACRNATTRAVFPERALAAIKLRHAAEVHYAKNPLARVTSKTPGNRARTAKLLHSLLDKFDSAEQLADKVERLLSDVKAHPDRYTRTTLTDVAVQLLMESLNFDRALYEEGIRRAGRWEGVHSTLGRGITLAVGGVAFGVGEAATHGLLQVSDHLLKGIRITAHQVPSAIVNPVVTGMTRIRTDVKEGIKRSGGMPNLTHRAQDAPFMTHIRQRCTAAAAQLNAANEALQAAVDANPVEIGPALLKEVQDAFDVGCAVQAEYKRRMAAGKAQTWSKGYGMGVNALAGAAQTLVVVAPPLAPIGLAIQGACVPLQWAAGYLDEHTKHRYHFRVNLKCGDFLTEEGRRLPVDELEPRHIDQAALRASFQTYPEQKVALIREVYECELGRLKQDQAELRQTIARIEASPPPRPAVHGGRLPAAQRAHREIAGRHRHKLRVLEQRIQSKQAEVARFESLDENKWRTLGETDPERSIARCIEDDAYLESEARRARESKPGEVSSQILQRYAQAYQALLSIGVTGPLSDVLSNVEIAALSPAQVSGIAAGLNVVGSALFAGITGDVRLRKVQNKKQLAQSVAVALEEGLRRFEADAVEWTFTVKDARGNDKLVDLRKTGAYDRHFHTRAQRGLRLLNTTLGSLVSAPRGAWHTIRAKRGLARVKGGMQHTLDLLDRALPDERAQPRLPVNSSGALKQRSITSFIDRNGIGSRQ
jgi:hypothetical protein